MIQIVILITLMGFSPQSLSSFAGVICSQANSKSRAWGGEVCSNSSVQILITADLQHLRTGAPLVHSHPSHLASLNSPRLSAAKALQPPLKLPSRPAGPDPFGIINLTSALRLLCWGKMLLDDHGISNANRNHICGASVMGWTLS